MDSDVPAPAVAAQVGSMTVLLTLASGQFLMALDSSVMNVSIATVAEDLGTTVTGIQTAITLYTLVMASLMITGGKIGQIIGRKRAFAIGCVIYGAGSLTTAVSPNLTVLLIGWSLLEGIGAALIMPAIVALVASNFGRAERPKAYGLVAAAAAIAVAVGPADRRAASRPTRRGATSSPARCSSSWSSSCYARRMEDAPRGGGRAPRPRRHRPVGTRSRSHRLRDPPRGSLGVRHAPSPGAPVWLGLSPVIWLVLGGGVVLLGFLGWERRRLGTGEAVLIDPAMLDNKLLRGGLTSFFFQYLLQAGLFFAVPLFLSIALGLSAIETGRADPAAVDHAADRRGGHPEVLPRGVAASGRPGRLPAPVRSAS